VKRLVRFLTVALLLLVAVLAGRALTLDRRQVPPGEPAAIEVDALQAAARLAGALRFPTISWGDATRRDQAAFLALHDYLRAQFPRAHATLTRETVAGLSLLYTWTGADPAQRPLLLLGHLDVVPAEPTTSGPWTHPPFAGVVSGGRVWGRGTLDSKGSVLGLLEAVEALLVAGFKPARTVYLAFGHNEEGDGDASGAAAVAATLASRGVRNAWLLDEGGLIHDRVPGVARPVALVGIAEKTAVDLELVARAPGGHSSMPAPETAVSMIASAIDRLQHHPMPARLDASNPTRQTLTTLAPDMSWVLRTAVANLWLLRPVVTSQLAATPSGNATIRTTITPTQVTGSPKSNVIAAEARAVLNARLLPGDSVEDVIAHLRTHIDDDRVEIRVLGQTRPGSVSPTGTPEFDRLQRAIRAVFPDVLVAPFLTIGATDAREYAAIAPESYRFIPVLQDGALALIHGVDEHVRIDVYEKMIRAYATIVKELAGG
jgi:carboxypeptidase PM20D1